MHATPPLKNPPRLFLRYPWDRLLPLGSRLIVWGLLFAVLYLLRSFFVLIFLTFVFAYIQSSVVSHLLPYGRGRRSPLVVLTGMLFLTVIIALSLFLAPRVYQQAAGFAEHFTVYVQRIDEELLQLGSRYPALENAIPELRELRQSHLDNPGGEWNIKQSPTGTLLEMMMDMGRPSDQKEHLKQVLNELANISRQAVAMISTFLLALLFSFLIVLDLPRLSRSVTELNNTKLHFIYAEVADNIADFGRVLGQAMEAQFFIACINTLLTALGLYLLGLADQVAFLSMIVFLCSFIPVAGVFISSAPICLIALKTGGVTLVAISMLLIGFIHLIEAYILNPRIYGARLRINPVIVLIILTVGGKLFHIWGLILGVPICTYIFGHAIRHQPRHALPRATRERAAKPHLTDAAAREHRS